ncbi:5-formyltetrahydrofolate cyclo-ligase [Georgenia sp. TF02-10]|uniref:5-formyltetrahydrofolate cyclo-ligase n=1 Tax=Georgenia sp. TF02-10 TaxID=2917725 RepID=UPI001FA6AF2E|nr:5-formyltetrahydrofolate cyclo-ligase [Georgenia sp. TF02-10]UNX55455.1 5-formyltetrahydrofolate cyclo-ligase [Georgenia sp. TF02-10]
MHRAQVALPPTAGYEVEDAKQELRAAVRRARSRRSDAERAAAGERLAVHALEAVGDARCVAAYVSRKDEPSSLPTLQALQDRGVRVLLPVLGPGLSRTWAEYRDAADLQVRAPGRPPEPSGEVFPTEAIAEADAVLAPALAVDAVGTRLGQGGGWYDRVLAHVRPGVTVFAMIYAEELIADRLLPAVEHDRPVDAVITPEEWFLLAGSTFQSEVLAARSAPVPPLRSRR